MLLYVYGENPAAALGGLLQVLTVQVAISKHFGKPNLQKSLLRAL